MVHIILLCFCLINFNIYAKESSNNILDILEPYSVWPNVTRKKRNTLTDDYEILPINNTKRFKDFEIRYFAQMFNNIRLTGHHTIFQASLFSVQPAGGDINACSTKNLETVEYSSNISNCKYATNAGFFNITDGKCLGYIVTNGSIIHDSANINAHFGITKNNSLFIGYLESKSINIDDFKQLVGGVIWIVRNSKSYIDESITRESPETQATGTLKVFASIRSARTAIGYDNYGNIHLVQVDGKSNLAGLSLYDMAELLISMGIQNAINLDGGGSSTAVLHRTLVNYPSDIRVIDEIEYSIQRNVSSIICASYTGCIPSNCLLHGSCVDGRCQCSVGWVGDKCDTKYCPQRNCLDGICTLGECYNEFILTEKFNTIVSQTEKLIWLSSIIFLFLTSTISLLIVCCCRFKKVGSNSHYHGKRLKSDLPLMSEVSSEEDTIFSSAITAKASL